MTILQNEIQDVFLSFELSTRGSERPNIYNLSSLSAASWHPPMITKFIQKDLVNPNDVKYDDRPYAFELPCEASGTNLTWKWKHNDTEITTFNDRPYFLSDDGTLTGNHLAAEHSGSYQCFVKDEKTGIEVFSRKLKVAVTGKYLFTIESNTIYQAPDTVFHPISKHREESVRSGVFMTKFEMFGNRMKHCLECLIYLLNRNKN